MSYAQVIALLPKMTLAELTFIREYIEVLTGRAPPLKKWRTIKKRRKRETT